MLLANFANLEKLTNMQTYIQEISASDIFIMKNWAHFKK